MANPPAHYLPPPRRGQGLDGVSPATAQQSVESKTAAVAGRYRQLFALVLRSLAPGGHLVVGDHTGAQGCYDQVGVVWLCRPYVTFVLYPAYYSMILVFALCRCGSWRRRGLWTWTWRGATAIGLCVGGADHQLLAQQDSIAAGVYALLAGVSGGVPSKVA
eukprot:COSAG01_NODE_1418_length_10375_cov_38.842254_13_plen_161_part_00